MNDITQNDVAMLEIAKQYFSELAATAVELNSLIESAETATKKNYFRKKLKKNNDLAIELLQRIEQKHTIDS